MGVWYGPAETWPTHPKSWWRESLDLARGAGWHLNKQTDHGWGKIACAPLSDALPAGDVCMIRVDGTANNGEKFAIIARQKITSCNHGAQQEARAAGVRTARELINDARGYLAGAQNLIAEKRNLSEASALLDRALEDAASASLLIDQASELEDRAEASQKQARATLLDGGYDGRVTAPDVLSAADRKLDAAGPLAARDADLIVQHEEAVELATNLRSQLDGLVKP